MAAQANARTLNAKRTLAKGRGSAELYRLVVPALTGIALGIVVLIAMISVIAYIFSRIDLPLTLMVPLATLSIGTAVFAAALTFAMIYGKHGMVLGTLTGILLVFAVCGISVLPHTGEFTQLSAVKGLLMAVCGALGGFFGVGRYQKHRKKRK